MRLLCAYYASTNTSKTPNRKNKNKRPILAQASGKNRKIRKIVFEFGADENKTSEFPKKRRGVVFKQSGRLVGT